MLILSGMNLEKAIEICGGVTALGRRLEVSQAMVSQWRNGERKIPEPRCREIEIATEGAVTCEQLRPDVDWRRWKDLHPEASADVPTSKTNRAEAQKEAA